MGETSKAIGQVLSYLKSELKRQGLTYTRVGEHLGVAEVSVKRLLNSDRLSLGDLEKLAELLGYDVLRLMATAAAAPVLEFSFSEEQEAKLAARPETFSYYWELRNGKTPAHIERKAGISPASTRKYLRTLEELQLIEVLPGDRVKLLHPGTRILFIPNGPLNAYFFPRRLANVTRRMHERGQPNVFAPAVQQGWFGRYTTIYLNDAQHLALIAEMEDMLTRHDNVSATSRPDEPTRAATGMAVLLDRFDVYEDVFPPIIEC